MEFFRRKTHIDFVGIRYYAFALSGAMILASLVSLFWQGLNYGIDFSGGTLVQLRFDSPAPVKEIRGALAGLELGDVVIQEFGSPEEVLIRVEAGTGNKGGEALAERMVAAIQPLSPGGKVETRRVEFVGPQVGDELRRDGILATLYSFVAILAYVAFRFRFHFALGAVLALFHDVIITVGYFSLFQKEFTLVVVAAILTVIGYSINDTIVVYDRIREEMKRLKKQPLGTVINEAVNGTLSRTVLTSFTVVVVLLALLFIGGEVIHDFALALTLGVVVGTYSSIFVASPTVLFFDRSERAKPV
ncbi:MAG: protein translocase subunit SecF [Magnetococcales bacterium]|nr:protein translocase subunit SecF [Magnetococcales bacterium]MBF0156847.1 protein translocase subunit SecF [Magnetococcales bacterium]